MATGDPERGDPRSIEALAAAEHWKKFGWRDHHGVAIPLSALRSEHPSGIGEFPDLKLLIDWCVEVGFDLIQLLPLNDSGLDPSPYNALSSMALNPVYLRLDGEFEGSYQEIYQKKEKAVDALNLPCEKSDPWTESYAQFKGGDPSHHLRVQCLCDRQLRDVKSYADERGVRLMGDIPILLSPSSVDVQTHPELFDTDVAVGCPPDLYSSKGQYWGFPNYNWEKMEKTGFKWWHQRLEVAGRYFHSYRIDHVVGFFHLWIIPKGKSPKEGRYLPPHVDQWLEQGEKLMRVMLDASQMLPVGEDLGVVPGSVKRCLHHLGIATTQFLPWERAVGEYTPFESYSPLSLTTLATHDSEPLALWWENYPKHSQALADHLGWTWSDNLTPDQRFNLLKLSHQTNSLFHINPLQEYLALDPTLVGTPQEERINTPGTHSKQNWTYRMKPTLESLLKNNSLKASIRDILGR